MAVAYVNEVICLDIDFRSYSSVSAICVKEMAGEWAFLVRLEQRSVNGTN